MDLRKRAMVALPLAFLVLGGSLGQTALANGGTILDGNTIEECFPNDLEDEDNSFTFKFHLEVDTEVTVDGGGGFFRDLWDWLTGGGNGGGETGGGETGGGETGGGETGGGETGGGETGGGETGGGETGGGETGGGETGGDTGGIDTGGDTGGGDTGGVDTGSSDTGDSAGSSSSSESCAEVAEQVRDAMVIDVAAIRGDILSVTFAENDKVSVTKLNLDRPIPVPARIRRQYRLRGDWYVQPGAYEANGRTFNLKLVRR